MTVENREAAGPAPKAAASLALPIAAVLVAMAAFQAGAALVKGLFPAVGPQGAAALRLTAAAVMLAVLFRPWRAWPRRTPWVALAGLGLGMAGLILFSYMAIARLPLGIVIALQFLGPLSVAVAGSRRPADFLWALLALAGVWALLGSRAAHVRLDPAGVGWALAAAASWAGYIVFGRRASAAFGASAAALATGIAAVVVLPAGVAHAGAALLSPALLPLVLLVAAVSTALPTALELYALPRMPARTFGVFMSLEPAFGALSGFVILHEALTAPQLVGVAAVIMAAAGSALGARR
ncbi:EamA family transporter [Phenylobacterium sp.]|jgi:inner membrane transporter RhtA|uniref:EamA family transporter n=1 Tax=Phenylobacterium sp. TaxID=1871053 RepID=UPI002F3F9D37